MNWKLQLADFLSFVVLYISLICFGEFYNVSTTTFFFLGALAAMTQILIIEKFWEKVFK